MTREPALSLTLVERVGSATLRYLEYAGALVIQLGNALGTLGRTLPFVGNQSRWRSAIRQMLAVGVDAFPMVGIMAVCAGFILAMQGASELRRLGAMQFVVDLVTIGFTRELGPLLAAIGRIADCRAQRIQITLTKSVVDPLELLRFRAPFFVSRHIFGRPEPRCPSLA